MKELHKKHQRRKQSVDVDEAKRLIEGADALLSAPFSDEHLDKVNERKFLLEYEALHPKHVVLLTSIKPYMKKFPKVYYIEIYRLHGWDAGGNKIHQRPAIVGKWTNELIYLRFPSGLLRTLQKLNPANENGIRLHKHFQWLNDIGESNLSLFIDDAVRLMQRSRGWQQFKRNFAKEFGASYQLDMFDTE